MGNKPLNMNVITSRAAVYTPKCAGQVRHSSGKLKELGIRLKSITNIQKITKTMKMISASKAIVPARAYGEGAVGIYEKAGVEAPATADNSTMLYVAVSSDRGLCGALHSSIGREVRDEIAGLPQGADAKVITIGEKAKAVLAISNPGNMAMEMKEYGRLPPTFADASAIADQIMKSGVEFDKCVIVYNWFKSAMTNIIKHQPVFSEEAVATSSNMSVYDSLDEDVIKSFQEFQLANTVYYTIKENYTSEQGARMVSMDGATKNAGEIIEKMALTYNRTRQAVITTELTEIISGMTAL